MARKVFFSFKYEDVSRAMVVRNSDVIRGTEKAGFIDAADFEKVKRQGDQAIKNWIDHQLQGTSVTVVLVGAKTRASRWVKYEIEQSIKRGNGLLGVDISKIKDFKGTTSDCCGELPAGYPFYLWFKGDGYANLGSWIEAAARKAGR
ncbi:TIR domain-containing protein [Cellvibrio sp. UBA7671]|uniref:TIR domain-containing protein n=1 Tax=Cellvibrio sp. UBA7671 TaxID=1946312 RepID=UPI002F356A71